MDNETFYVLPYVPLYINLCSIQLLIKYYEL